VVEVPSSIDGPHLIYKNDYFGAPVRNDADTVWMRERQVEAMYRARFDARRHATEALDALSREASAGRDTRTRAWLVAVGHPRIPRARDRLARDDARALLTRADELALAYAGHRSIHPLESVERLNPRPGLRRWVAVNTAAGERSSWKEAWASLHHDGSVTLAAAIGGHRISHHRYAEGWRIAAPAIECATADFMALVRATAEATDSTEYEVRVGIDWTGDEPLVIQTVDNFGYPHDGTSVPMHSYTPVEATVIASASDPDYFWQVHDLAQDCVNQGGVSELFLIKPPDREGG
jgi:hypothetical protein